MFRLKVSHSSQPQMEAAQRVRGWFYLSLYHCTRYSSGGRARQVHAGEPCVLVDPWMGSRDVIRLKTICGKIVI